MEELNAKRNKIQAMEERMEELRSEYVRNKSLLLELQSMGEDGTKKIPNLLSSFLDKQ